MLEAVDSRRATGARLFCSTATPRVDELVEGEVVKPGDVQLRIIQRWCQRPVEPVGRRAAREKPTEAALLAR
jgi:hypothetical protein